MKHRKLRIAWSVAWGVAAAMLIVLWASSYFFYDRVCLTVLGTDSLQLNSQEGRMELSYGPEFFVGGAYSGEVLYFRHSPLSQQDRAWFDADNPRWRNRVFL